jgi:hypothetical protein
MDYRTFWVLWLSAGWMMVSSPSLRSQDAAQKTVSSCPLFVELIEPGLRAATGDFIPMEGPGLKEGLDSTAQQSVLEKLSGNDGWERFSRSSVVAPVTVSIQSINDGKSDRYGYQLHSAYVLHSPMSTLRDQSLMERTFGKPTAEDQEAGLSIRELKPNELSSVDPKFQPVDNVGYSYIEIPLLSKIRLDGAIRVERHESARQLDIAWVFDDRFSTSSDKLSNQWTKLKANELGKLEAGSPNPYGGAGGWIRLFEVSQNPPQVVVEMRWILHEPDAWFNGGNLLRSKLPILIQESVRSFRRKLAQAS